MKILILSSSFVLLMIACSNSDSAVVIPANEEVVIETKQSKNEIPSIDSEELILKENAVKIKKPNKPDIEKIFNSTTITEDLSLETKVEQSINNDSFPKNIQNINDHEDLDQLLKVYVNSKGLVDYQGFKKDQFKLKKYLDATTANAPSSDWSKNKSMAYWINLYNALTLYSILESYPVNSILDLHGGDIWNKKKFYIGKSSYTLNEIEKEILLKKYKDPRIHFAVNCAAKSCPPLLNSAWTEENLVNNFQKQARNFINNNNFNKISADKIQVSQIFNWYHEDFGGKNNLINYLNQFSKVQISNKAAVDFLEYDWKLNKQ